MNDQNRQGVNRKLLLQLFLVAVAAFAFSFALVPLYDAFCNLVGINRGDNVRTEAVTEAPDPDRTVTVKFVLSVNSGRWEFEQPIKRLDVHPGKLHTVGFTVRNLANGPVVGQAVFSTAPIHAGAYVRKTECFCFTPQPFAPNETRELPMRFMLDPALPANIETVTFAYTLYALEEGSGVPGP